MKIESKIKRKNGHDVTFGADRYEFRPPAYVVEVKNPEHVEKFLAVPEGYRLAEPAAQPVEFDPADTNGDGVVDDSEERAELVKQYQERFGKKPHHKAGIEKIRAELAAGAE